MYTQHRIYKITKKQFTFADRILIIIPSIPVYITYANAISSLMFSLFYYLAGPGRGLLKVSLASSDVKKKKNDEEAFTPLNTYNNNRRYAKQWIRVKVV